MPSSAPNTLHIVGVGRGGAAVHTSLPAVMSTGTNACSSTAHVQRGGRFSSAGNADFDAALRCRRPRRGIRATSGGGRPRLSRRLVRIDDHAMPANNRFASRGSVVR
jgi:hypothetical protein